MTARVVHNEGNVFSHVPGCIKSCSRETEDMPRSGAHAWSAYLRHYVLNAVDTLQQKSALQRFSIGQCCFAMKASLLIVRDTLSCI
jgi:hypothetical protein